MSSGEAWRLFVAAELPPRLKDSLSAVQDSLLRVAGGGVRWVDSRGIHITLKFLGNVDSGRRPELEAGLKRACQGGRPPALTIGGLGAFPDLRSPRVIWVGVSGDTEALADLARRVDEEMAGLGFPRETRPFAAHLTLGRVRDSVSAAQRRALGEGLRGVEVGELGRFAVEELSLMRSVLDRRGARYQRLLAVAFSG